MRARAPAGRGRDLQPPAGRASRSGSTPRSATRPATGPQPLTQSELAIDSPYNTRTRAGLPPGPIGNPGLASLQAAARPARVGYLYYVVKPGTCGEHAFSSTVRASSSATSSATTQAREAAGGKSPDEVSVTQPMTTLVAPPRPARSATAARRRCTTPPSRQLGLDWRYEAARRRAGALRRGRARACPAQGFVGANVTIPHKLRALEAGRRCNRGRPGGRRRQHARLRGRADRWPTTPTWRAS